MNPSKKWSTSKNGILKHKMTLVFSLGLISGGDAFDLNAGLKCKPSFTE